MTILIALGRKVEAKVITVQQLPYQVGETAGKTIIDRIEYPSKSIQEVQEIKGKIRIRDSVNYLKH